jgi:hypothetical protein
MPREGGVIAFRGVSGEDKASAKNTCRRNLRPVQESWWDNRQESATPRLTSTIAMA